MIFKKMQVYKYHTVHYLRQYFEICKRKYYLITLYDINFIKTFQY